MSKDVAQEVLDGILEEVGDAGAQLLGSDGLALKIRGVISTGNIGVDRAIGRWGIPLGRLTIVHGAEASGKTTLALQAVAECQATGGVAVYIDKEYKLDPDYAAALGVDIKRLIIVQPSYLEKVFTIIEAIVGRAASIRKKSGKRIPILVVLDSMNACITKHMFEAEDYDTVEIAGPPRVWSQKLPKLMPLVSAEDVALCFISQVRTKIGVMFGDPDDICGGNAPKFFASLIIHMKYVGAERKDGEKFANKVRVECKKNQIAPPFKKHEVLINYGYGMDSEYSTITDGAKVGILKKSGGIYSYKDIVIGKSLLKSAKALKKNTKLRDEIIAKIKAA